VRPDWGERPASPGPGDTRRFLTSNRSHCATVDELQGRFSRVTGALECSAARRACVARSTVASCSSEPKRMSNRAPVALACAAEVVPSNGPDGFNQACPTWFSLREGNIDDAPRSRVDPGSRRWQGRQFSGYVRSAASMISPSSQRGSSVRRARSERYHSSCLGSVAFLR
jgi:hypothetical protein